MNEPWKLYVCPKGTFLYKLFVALFVQGHQSTLSNVHRTSQSDLRWTSGYTSREYTYVWITSNLYVLKSFVMDVRGTSNMVKAPWASEYNFLYMSFLYILWFENPSQVIIDTMHKHFYVFFIICTEMHLCTEKNL